MSDSSKNATKHGCCAPATLILPTENKQDFEDLEISHIRSYLPKCEQERHLLQEIVIADWFLQRATRALAQVEAGLYAETPNPADWSEAQERKLGRHIRYRTAQTNVLAKARKAFDDYRKRQITEALLAERLKAAQKKNEPKPEPGFGPGKSNPDWHQHLRNMRAEAVARGFVSPDEPNPFDKY